MSDWTEPCYACRKAIPEIGIVITPLANAGVYNVFCSDRCLVDWLRAVRQTLGEIHV